MTPQELNENIKQAMKAHDNLTRDTYRLVLNETKNIEVNERRDITEKDVNDMIKRVLKQTKETYEYALKTDNQELINELQNKINILEQALPAQLEGINLIQRVGEILDTIPNPSKKSIGQVMKQLTQETDGNFDKSAVSNFLNRAFVK